MHNGPHVLGSLGESVFQDGDGSKDFRKGDQGIRSSLGPDVDRSRSDFTVVGLVATRTLAVNVELHDGSPDHGETSTCVSTDNLSDRRKPDLPASQEWVEHLVKDGDENDQEDGVNVLDEIVGNTVQRHGGSLRGQVSSDLVVREPVDGVEYETDYREEYDKHWILTLDPKEPCNTHTLQAEMARLTSSTHSSSNFIQAGRSPTTMVGLARSPIYHLQIKSEAGSHQASPNMPTHSFEVQRIPWGSKRVFPC